MSENLEKLFDNQSHLTHALTHKSWVNEHKNFRTSNERLEFLGDAILEFVVSKELFKKYPDKEEGYLTALRANLVNTVSLAEIANSLNLGPLLFLSKGEEDGGGRTNQSILADTVEALIGALFIDGGIKKAENFIKDILLSDLDMRAKKPLKDYKSRLQEIVQARGFSAPKYSVIGEKGPDHDKTFTLEVLVDTKRWGKGEGRNKSEAAQMAAKNALEKMA